MAGDTAVVCTSAAAGTPKRSASAARARGLDVAVEQARADLAALLRIEANRIHVDGLAPVIWSGGHFGCDREKPDAGRPVNGYRLFLSALGRSYTYHTDLNQVFACPALATHDIEHPSSG